MKLKTQKSVAKRIKLSGAKTSSRLGRGTKMTRKAAGQDHFNAREPGSVTRKKRRPVGVAKGDEKNIRRLLPYA